MPIFPLGAVAGQITALTEGNERRQEVLRANVEANLGELKTDAGLSAKALRKEITNNLQNLGTTLGKTIDQISQSQRERLDRVSVDSHRVDPAELRPARDIAQNGRGTA
jgi:gas vesicle protein